MEEDLDLGTFGDKKKKKKKKKPLDLDEVIGEEEDKENEGGNSYRVLTSIVFFVGSVSVI
jgi:mRNA-degrading endonuclease HigB of HigAB toxin-antitoxin module